MRPMPDQEMGPDSLVPKGLPSARRGYDHHAVEQLLRRAREAWVALQEEHRRLLAEIDRAGGLEYLARYGHRVAMANSQLDAITDSGVTFHFRDRKSDTVRSCTLEPLVFLSRFLQHVLPRGFAKVRSYGLLAPTKRARQSGN